MNSQLNYQIIELSVNGHPALQTLGVNHILGVEFSMYLVIDKSLTRGILTQVTQYFCMQLTQPSLFTDPWSLELFKENKSLCLLPFILLEEASICHIIIPDSSGYYPWQPNCASSFKHQADEALILSNFLLVIKSLFLSHLMQDIAKEVYQEIGIPIHFDFSSCMNEFPDYLGELNLDMLIVLMLCLNKMMPTINQYILSACENIPLSLSELSNPLISAREIVSQIYHPTLKTPYIPMIMDAFYKLTES